MPIFCLVQGLKSEQQNYLKTKTLKFEIFVQLKKWRTKLCYQLSEAAE